MTKIADWIHQHCCERVKGQGNLAIPLHDSMITTQSWQHYLKKPHRAQKASENDCLEIWSVFMASIPGQTVIPRDDSDPFYTP